MKPITKTVDAWFGLPFGVDDEFPPDLPSSDLTDEEKVEADIQTGVIDGVEWKAVTRHVRTPAGVEKYDRPIGSPIAPHPHIPHPAHHPTASADTVIHHQSDPDRNETLLRLYASGLPNAANPRHPDLIQRDALDDVENRSAAKSEVARRVTAQLDPDTRKAMAVDIATRSLEENAAVTEYSNLISVEDKKRVLQALPTDPFDSRLIWKKVDWDDGSGQWKADWHENAMHFAGLTDPSDMGGYTYPPDPPSGSTAKDAEGHVVHYLRGNDPRLITSLAENAVSDYIHGWAETSNDHNPRSLATQEAIRQEFDLQNTMGWDVEAIIRNQFKDYPDDAESHVEQWREEYADEKAKIPLYRKLARAQYDETQQWFKDNGISELLVYRGMAWKADREGTPTWFDDALLKPKEEVTVDGVTEEVDPTIDMPQLRPASSWAWNSRTAKNFAGMKGGADRNENQATLATVVPVTAVLGTPRTGFGALPEHEVVLLAVGGTVQVDARGPKRRDELVSAATGVQTITLPEGEVAGLKEALRMYDADPNSEGYALRGWYTYVYGDTMKFPDGPTMKAKLLEALAGSGGGGG